MFLDEARKISLKLSKEKEIEIRKHMFGDTDHLDEEKLTLDASHNNIYDEK
ncbi:hypothetical protein [Clostridium sp. DJ247]|uniref:hypothetical protein n=1 Tax=Clostridium sp. DJ247 TaxID=2726188 RepID=UPI00162437B2|nr:hypothetical protein [Clostridium sp. DJ247]MBC2582544.1 hypothetical protein [Clostridium sp. DJ247]